MRVTGWAAGAAALLALGGCETLTAAAGAAGAAGAAEAKPAAAPAPQPAPSPPVYAEAAEESLAAAESALAGEVTMKGLGPALAAALDPIDGYVVRGGRVFQGSAVAEGLRPPLNAGPLYLQPDRLTVSRSADLGVTSGRYVQVLRGQEAIQGRYMITWRKDAEGRWRPLSEVAVNDPPMAAPAPAALRGAPTRSRPATRPRPR